MHGWDPPLHVDQYIENKQGPMFCSRWVIGRGGLSPLGALESPGMCQYVHNNATQIQTAFSALPQGVLVSIS